MATPASGAISINDLNTVSGAASGTQKGLDWLRDNTKDAVKDLNSAHGREWYQKNNAGNCSNGNCNCGSNCSSACACFSPGNCQYGNCQGGNCEGNCAGGLIYAGSPGQSPWNGSSWYWGNCGVCFATSDRQCVNCVTNCSVCSAINCTNCDARSWLQSNCNCACTYNCNTTGTIWNNCSNCVCMCQ